MAKRAAPGSGGGGRQTQAASTSTNPARRPGAGNGASVAAAPIASAAQLHAPGPATPQVAQLQPAGTAISGQVVSISHATASSSSEPQRAWISSSAVPSSTAGTITTV